MSAATGSKDSRDDARAMQLLWRHGRAGTAFQVLAQGLSHWFDDDRGLVAYADTGGAWVAAGEPVAAPHDAIAVAARFVAAANAQGKRACFFATEGILAAAPAMHRLSLGEQPVWDPRLWNAHVSTHRSLREQLRRARAKGVSVREVTMHSLSSERELQPQILAVVHRWLASRTMPQMHFMVEVAPLGFLEHRRVFVGERNGKVVGLLSLAPVPARKGWLFEHLIREPRAPNGTSEMLVDAVMRVLATENATWATLGLAPLAGNIGRWLRGMRRVSRPLFNFDGLAAFKRKLRPQHWEPIYLAFPSSNSGFVAMMDSLRAFAGGALWRFAMRTVLRGPRPVLVVLEALLIPWTVLMALAPTTPWFPSARVHAAWVLFDVALYILLRSVRGRDWLTGARVAAAAVTLDAILTVWQAIAWNAPRVSSWSEGVMVVIACAGPALTAPILWGAARRMRMLQHER